MTLDLNKKMIVLVSPKLESHVLFVYFGPQHHQVLIINSNIKLQSCQYPCKAHTTHNECLTTAPK